MSACLFLSFCPFVSASVSLSVSPSLPAWFSLCLCPFVYLYLFYPVSLICLLFVSLSLSLSLAPSLRFCLLTVIISTCHIYTHSLLFLPCLCIFTSVERSSYKKTILGALNLGGFALNLDAFYVL